MQAELDFWQRLERLAQECPLVIDRPAGSRHPRWPDFVYPYDYGYLDGSTAADGGGIDAWRGSLPEPRVSGVICTVDGLKRDAEIKVLIGCTREEMRAMLKAHNSDSQSGLLVERSGP